VRRIEKIKDDATYSVDNSKTFDRNASPMRLVRISCSSVCFESPITSAKSGDTEIDSAIESRTRLTVHAMRKYAEFIERFGSTNLISSKPNVLVLVRAFESWRNRREDRGLIDTTARPRIVRFKAWAMIGQKV
jgi:hypothetical protein